MSVSLIFFPYFFFISSDLFFDLFQRVCDRMSVCIGAHVYAFCSIRFSSCEWHFTFCFVQVQIEQVFFSRARQRTIWLNWFFCFVFIMFYNYTIVVVAAEQPMQKVVVIFQIWELETKTSRIDWFCFSFQFCFRMYLLEFSRINIPHLALQIYSLLLFCIQFSFRVWNPFNEKKKEIIRSFRSFASLSSTFDRKKRKK